MQHFPIFLSLTDRSVVLSGGGDAALAKLRLLLKTPALIAVFAPSPAKEILAWAREARIDLKQRVIREGDIGDATLFYAANENPAEDTRAAAIAKAEGALVNIVDNLRNSEFITPAIVDRDPVTIAIGTEGAAPVLARAIKADLEQTLPSNLGLLARIGKAFRPMAERLPMGRSRRKFWAEFYLNKGPKAFDMEGQSGVETALVDLLSNHLVARAPQGFVEFTGAGPGDPDLLTLKARKALDRADVVLHDHLVSAQVLELARREARIVDVGKSGFGRSMAQSDINDLMVKHALKGEHVVRLKSGDPTIFGRLDEEIDAADAAGIEWRIIPGITAASAGVAAIGQSLTQRGRNSAVRMLTGHDMQGFGEHDWATLVRPGEVAVIYMGKRAARFIQGRLLMHGAAGDTPVTFIENASRGDQRTIATTLTELAQAMTKANMTGPALTFIGLTPRAAVLAADEIHQKEIAL